jgi:hypothetical protein
MGKTSEAEEFVMKILKFLEGKQTKTEINLDGIELDVGDSKIKVDGRIDLKLTPIRKKK